MINLPGAVFCSACCYLAVMAATQGFRRATGSWDYFKPALALYRAHGFVLCGPFQGYVEDTNSLFLTLDLSASR